MEMSNTLVSPEKPIITGSSGMDTNTEIVDGKEMVVKENFLLFWNGFPSQWHPSTFVLDKVVYNCCEQYMMACKAKTFKDTERLDLIMQSNSPAFQKKMGREVENYDEDVWNAVREDVVLYANLAKFTQDSSLKQWLLATKDLVIVEASPYDKIWGIGMYMDNPNAIIPDKWNGLNLLGVAVMKARTIIRNMPAEWRFFAT
jgi:ribA/ribD-fused uncharacterized protein